LVGGGAAGAHEGRVVAGDHGYVAVAAGAEFRVVVAGCCIDRFGRRGGGGGYGGVAREVGCRRGPR
jgi:hypothetical protein